MIKMLVFINTIPVFPDPWLDRGSYQWDSTYCQAPRPPRLSSRGHLATRPMLDHRNYSIPSHPVHVKLYAFSSSRCTRNTRSQSSVAQSRVLGKYSLADIYSHSSLIFHLLIQTTCINIAIKVYARWRFSRFTIVIYVLIISLVLLRVVTANALRIHKLENNYVTACECASR